MKLPSFLAGVPRIVFVLAIPLVAFLIFVGLSLGSGGDDNKDSKTDAVAQTPTSAPSRTPTAAATPTAQPVAAAPTATPVVRSCNEIRGTDYKSPEERDYFQKSCAGNTAAGSGGGPITGAQAAPSAGQAPTGERLIVPAASVDVPVWLATVGSNLVMPDPVGYFNAVRYNFSAGGFGGDSNSGNMVLAAHVDCAHCQPGGTSGVAAFYYVRNLKVGDTAQFIRSDGSVINYVVTSSVSHSANDNFNPIVSPGFADMTLITCTGTFSGGEYNLRHVVAFRKV